MVIGRIPDKVKIKREEHYHTHHIGKFGDGYQFMAFVVGVTPQIDDRKRKIRWYAVLHRFDGDGNHLGTEASFLGTAAFAKQLSKTDSVLTEMLGRLGKINYSDIA